MAAKRKTKSPLNRRPSVTYLPEATPLAIGRSVRCLVANKDVEGLIRSMASLMARCEAKLIKGTDMFTKAAVKKWTDWAFANLYCDRIFTSTAKLAELVDDEWLGSAITDMIVNTVWGCYQERMAK